MYASRTGTRENLALMKLYGWRVLVSATGVWRHEGFPYALDNGAWTSFANGTEFDAGLFMGLVEEMGADAEWIALPDVVGDAARTSVMTDHWVPLVDSSKSLAVIQDGADPAVLDALIGHVKGFFLGGSTEYKLSTMHYWGDWCRERGVYYHVGRVNTARRVRLCISAGAHSCDGTCVTRFARKRIKGLSSASRITAFNFKE